MSTKRQIDRKNTTILVLVHLLAVAAIVYLATTPFSPWTVGLAVLWFVLSGLSITGGYHRLFSHRSYQAHPLVRGFYLLFGTAAVQNSALKWSGDHRRHHAQTDRDPDPYSVKVGFLWSHIGWVLYQPTHFTDPDQVRDLHADRLVMIQHRYYVPIALMMGAVVPGLLGLIWGDPIGALLVAGFLRLVVQWHATFSVNSLAHTIGSQPFTTANSARDSFWTAIVTLGEGYHNFHHAFQHDYRNGIRWYHLDPTKWTLWSFEKVGLANNLRRVAPATIEARREKISQEQRAGNSDVKVAIVPPAPGSTTTTVGDASTTRLTERDHDGAGASRNDPEVELAQLP
jgi:stearoyl-CoA desaturase (delta-9 desaturase)